MRKATIVDVAELAGVSMKTVARVVNEVPGVKVQTVSAVHDAIARLGYRRNLAARALKSEQSFLIGLFSMAAGASYLVPFSRGAAKICRERGYHLMLEHLQLDEPDLLGTIDSVLRTADFHAVILPPPLCNDTEVVARFVRRDVRVLLLDPIDRDEAFAHIEIDDGPGVEALVAHAIALGHKRFAIVNGALSHRAAMTRYEVFLRSLAAAGHHDVTSVPGDFTFASGFAAGETLFLQPDPPSFIFAANDDMAAGVMAAAVRAGIRVPEEISLAGFDDSDISKQVWPPLTTICQNIGAIAEASVDILTRPLSQKDEVSSHFSVELVIRGSTGPAPQAGKRVGRQT